MLSGCFSLLILSRGLVQQVSEERKKDETGQRDGERGLEAATDERKTRGESEGPAESVFLDK